MNLVFNIIRYFPFIQDNIRWNIITVSSAFQLQKVFRNYLRLSTALLVIFKMVLMSPKYRTVYSTQASQSQPMSLRSLAAVVADERLVYLTWNQSP